MQSKYRFIQRELRVQMSLAAKMGVELQASITAWVGVEGIYSEDESKDVWVNDGQLCLWQMKVICDFGGCSVEKHSSETL